MIRKAFSGAEIRCRIVSMNDQIESHPHAWVPYRGDEHEEVCFLCGAFPNTPKRDILCVEPWPEVDPPPEGWEDQPAGVLIER